MAGSFAVVLALMLNRFVREKSRMMTMSVASLAERVARIPEFVLFGAAAPVFSSRSWSYVVDRDDFFC